MKTWVVIVLYVIGTVHSVQGQVANNDFYTAPAGSAFTVSAPGVLANDTGGSLTAMLVTGPANGTLTLNADGSFTYTPTNNFTGMDGFSYQAISGSLTSSVATAVITVIAPGELFYDNFARPAGTNSIFPWVQQSGMWSIANNLLVGTSVTNSYGYAYYDGNWTNYSVQAQIQFSANNAASAGILGRLDPASGGTHYALWIYPEESPELLASGNGSAVLRLIKYENWVWPYTLIGNAVTLTNGVGTSWHTVRLTFQGSNIFAYFDGNLVTNVTDDGSIDGQPAYANGGIGLNLWTLPSAAYAFSVGNVMVSTLATVANNDSYTATKNTTLKINAPGVLVNASGGNGSLTAILFSGPTHGSLNLNANGSFNYTPTSKFVGTDSFTYQATDGQTTSSVATVTITVNNPPIANTDIYSVAPGVLLNVPAPGVLANDTSSNSLTAILVNGPADGNFNWGGDGSFNYQSTNNFAGVDDFTYAATDGQTTSRVTTAAIEVLPPGKLFLDNFTHSPLWPWIQESSAWNITNGVLTGSSSFESYGHAYISNNWSDYIVQGSIQFSSTNAWGGGIGGRLMDPINGLHYAAWVYPESSPGGPGGGSAVMKLIKFHSWTDLNWSLLSQVTLTNGVGTNWHTVGLAFSSSNIFAYFDGEQVTNVTDDGTFDGQPAYTNGGICADMWTETPTAYTFSVSNIVVAPLTAVPAPVILSIGLTNDMVSITWSSVMGSTYEVQYTDNLNSNNWNNASSNLMATGSTATQTNLLGNVRARFYRVLLLPP